MRIAFLSHEPFYPPSGGGSAEAIYLVKEMVRRRHSVDLFCPRVADPVLVQKRFGVRLHEFKSWAMGRTTALRSAKYLLYPFFLQRMVERVWRDTPFDLVFSQHAIAAVAAGRLGRSLGVRVIMNFLDFLTGFMETWPSYLAPPPLLSRLKQFEISLPARYRVEGVLTVSDELADYFVQTGYARARLRPIYYGYDSALFPGPSAPATAPEGPPLFVMHGSLDHHHLGPIALETIGEISRRVPGAIFRLIGPKTPAVHWLSGEVRRRFPRAILQCTGFVPYEEVAAQLAGAAAGMVPYEESTGVHCAFVAKAVEYLAMGLPVASTPLKGLQRYFASEPMIRFARFNGRDLAGVLVEWTQVPWSRKQAWGQAAAQRVRQELDWQVISQRAMDFVEERMAGHPDQEAA